MLPHDLTIAASGGLLLWFGWYGFNAGSELQVDSVTALSFINTYLAASVAAAGWVAAKQDEERQDLPRAWQAFADQAPFWSEG